MRKGFRLLTFLLCITLLLPCAAASADTPRYHFDADFSQESLGDAIERYLASRYLSSYSVKIGWCDLQSGEEWYLDGDTFMECASTYKLPLAMIYVDKIAAGELTLDAKIGSYVLGDALENMLVNSHNGSGYILRSHVSEDVMEYRRLQAAYSGLSEDEISPAFYHYNLFSPRFMIGTLHTLYDNSERYSLILDYLKQARPTQYFSLYRGETEVAHKYGSYEEYVCDSGIIYTERPFLLCVMTYKVRGAPFIIGQIARIAMDYAEYLAAHPEPTPAPTPVPTPVPSSVPLPEPTPVPTPVPAPTVGSNKSLPGAAVTTGAVLIALPFILRRGKKRS